MAQKVMNPANSEKDRELNNEMTEYYSGVHIVTWTTGESGDLQDDIQLSSLTISSTKLGILEKDEIVKNNCLSLGAGFSKTLEDVLQQDSITSDQLRTHSSNADTLKSRDSTLSINHAHGSKRHQKTIPMERLQVLEEDIQRFLKQDRLFAEYRKNSDCTKPPKMDISLDAAWIHELDTISQKYICQKNLVDLIHSTFKIKPRADNIFALSAFTHLFRSCSMDSVLPLVSLCSLGISMLQHNILASLPRDDRKERKMMLHLQSDNAAVDSINLRASETALKQNVNEQDTTLPVMSISLVEGGYILLLSKNTYS